MAAAPSARREQSRPEEIANAATHGVAAGLAVAASAALVAIAARGGDPWRVVAASVYGASMVLLYLASALYHGARTPRAKSVLHLLDHAAIYLLIAGTYTPFTLVSLRGPWGWSLFGVIWALAAGGVALTLFPLARLRRAPVPIYLGMGWIVVVAIPPLLRAVGTAGVACLGAGGLLDTVGVVFYGWKSLRFNYAVWHLFVLGGSACHFIAVLAYVVLPRVA